MQNPHNRQRNNVVYAAAFQDHLLKSMGLPSLSSSAKRSSLPRMQGSMARNLAYKYAKPLPRIEKAACVQHSISDDEIVVDELEAMPVSLSLAERMGIVERKREITINWCTVKRLARCRHDTTKEPCSICQEPWSRNEQVILSCSHVFHRSCIDSYEHFAQRKCCPLCRSSTYQKRIIYDGKLFYLNQAATTIQRIYRGWISRKNCDVRYYEPKNLLLRKKYFERKWIELHNNIAHEVENDSIIAENVIREADQAISRMNVALNTLFTSQKSTETIEKDPLLDEDWASVLDKIHRRSVTECSICLQTYSRKKRSTVAVLDCAHVFHKPCLESLESFDDEHRCPMCRHANYQKIFLPSTLVFCNDKFIC